MDEKNFQQLLQTAQHASVICIDSTDEYLQQTTAARLTAALQDIWQDSETTRIAGEDLTLEEAVMAAGTISFFATRRIIRIDRLQPTAFSDGDMDEFCALLSDTENALFILTTWYKTGRDRKAKKTTQLKNAVQAAGSWVELAAPKGPALKQTLVQMARDLGADIAPDAADEMIERTGGDLQMLSCEVAKLAAGAGYGTITRATVAALGMQTVEADVFKMVDAVTSGRVADAFAILDKLLYLRSEPIAILGALSSSFVDMARVQTAARHKVGYAQVFKDLGYTGSDYRLKRAGQTAARYTPAQLQTALDILNKLDTDLKSSPVDNAVLLQTALARLCSVRTR